jgi:hypothetical protein
MSIDSFAGEHQTKTDEELLRLTMDLGPLLPSEVPKPPWRPKVAGRIAFFFGPVAGALVVASSLRRMGYQQRAKKVMLLALGAAAVEAAILFSFPKPWHGLWVSLQRLRSCWFSPSSWRGSSPNGKPLTRMAAPPAAGVRLDGASSELSYFL